MHYKTTATLKVFIDLKERTRTFRVTPQD
jgi:hypothetical protein